ncbi:MAG: transposase [Deltaproteobacteria bacterium]|nr:transposase [Deltaproteobacteria bacterium]
MASHLGQAVDRVRREEKPRVARGGRRPPEANQVLQWLTHPANLTDERWASFASCARALSGRSRVAIKELAMEPGATARTRGRARREALARWALRSRLDPVIRVARMIRAHQLGILNAMVHGVTNARPKASTRRSSGSSTRREDSVTASFRDAIYFSPSVASTSTRRDHALIGYPRKPETPLASPPCTASSPTGW